MTKQSKPNITIRATQELLDSLKARSEEEGISLNQSCLAALGQYLDTPVKQGVLMRLSALEDSVAALKKHLAGASKA